MAHEVLYNRWRISDALWARIQPLLPPHPRTDPWGRGRPRVDDRAAMNAILFVLKTGCQWNALNATGICSSSTAHARFQEWTQAGVWEKLWEQGLTEYDEFHGIQWEWQSMDGAMTKAPLGGEKNRLQPHRPGQTWRQAKSFDRGSRHSDRSGRRRGQPERHEAGPTDAGKSSDRAA